MSEQNNFGIDIFQPIVPEYRVALFDGLGRKYGSRIAIQASAGSGVDESVRLHDMEFDYDHPVKRIGPFVWQKGLKFVKAKNKGDVVVICGDIHQLSSLWLAIKAKIKGFRVIWWGHHKTYTSSKFGVAVRLFMAKALSDVYLTYTQAGVEFLIQEGFKKDCVFATGNTVDTKTIDNEIKKWTPEKLAEFKKREGITAKHVFLVSSVLREKTRLDVALQALKVLNEKGVDFLYVVIGDGVVREKLEALAESLGIAGRVRWLGKILDHSVMAPYFLSAQYFLYPGVVGLSITHSFAYGLPIITHGNAADHGPEFVLMKEGETGFAFEENNVESCVRVIENALSLQDDKLHEMKKSCRKIVLDNYSMDNMVTSYSKAIEGAFSL